MTPTITLDELLTWTAGHAPPGNHDLFYSKALV